MSFGERITKLRKEYGYSTRNEFADKLGIPSTTLRNYETNAREPGHTFLKQISEFFHVSVDYLLCLTDDREVLNSFRLCTAEQDMIEKYRNLDDHGKDMVDTVLDKEWHRSTAEQKPEIPAPVSMIREPKPDLLIPNAAHDIPGASEEAKAAADALIDNDEFWK